MTDPVTPADLVLHGGRVHIPEGCHNALAIRNGRIMATGSDDEILALAGPQTRIVDLAGRSVLPGFNDMHVHPLFAGLRMNQCRIPQGSDWTAFDNAVSAQIDQTPEGDWISGGQWDASSLGRVPNRFDLDRLSDRHPIYLNDTSGHSALANSLALELAGIGPDTPDPEGGIIERLPDDLPSGVLRERALEIVEAAIPKPTHDTLCKAVVAGHDALLRLGYTACSEASIGMVAGLEAELDAYAETYDNGLIHQRTRIFLIWEPDDPEADRVIADRGRYTRDRIDVDCIKIHLDGVPTDGHTAAMVEPYAAQMEGRDDDAARFGILLQDTGILNAALARFDAEGLTVKYHSVGDRAVRQGLDAIAHARAVNGPGGPRHELGHCTFVHPEDVARAADLDAVYEMSPYLFGPCAINDDIAQAVGPARADHAWPLRSLLNSGAHVVAGSDWPVVDDVSPWPAIETLVTRQRPGGSSDSFAAPEAITLREALDLFTRNPARVLGKEDELGCIAPGYLADLIVTDQNPFALPATRLHSIRTEMTLIAGEIVWEGTA